MEISLTYMFLTTLMVLCLYISGRWIAAGRPFWRSASLGIIAFTLNVGLRFGRQTDYNTYYSVYYEIYNNECNEGYDIGYFLFIKFLSFFNIDYQGYIIVVALLLCLSILIFLKNFKEISPYVLILTPLVSQSLVYDTTRQCLAFCFFLIGLSFLIESNSCRALLKYLFFGMVGFSIHSSIFFVIPLFWALFRLKSVFMSPKYSIPLFFFIVVFFSTSHLAYLFGFIKIILSIFSGFDKNYGGEEKFEYMFVNGGFMQFMGGVGISICTFFCLVILFGYGIVRKLDNHKFIFLYNVSLLSLIIYGFAVKVELVYRIDVMLFFFMPFIGSVIVIYYRYSDFFTARTRKLLVYGFVLLICNFMRTEYKDALEFPFFHQYVWDKHGHDTIDLGDIHWFFSKGKY